MRRNPPRAYRSLLALARRFSTNASGGIAIILALSLPVVLGTFTLAADYVIMSGLRTKLQAAADAAALSGASEISLGIANDVTIASLAKAMVVSNIATPEFSGKGQETKVEVAIKRKEGAISVSLSHHWAPLSLHLFDADAMPIIVNAQARIFGSNATCVISLSEGTDLGLELKVNATLTANGCGVYSNAASSKSVMVDDSSFVKAQFICVVGGYSKKRSDGLQPNPVTDCPEIDDPIAKRAPPPHAGCDFNGLTIDSGKRTLNPGVYCGGLFIKGNAQVTLNEGEYVIKDGELKVDDTAKLIGEFAGFYLVGDATKVLFEKNTTIDLAAPKDGPLAGLLFFESRTAAPLRVHRISSNHAHRLLGTIYLPRGILRVDAEAPVAAASAYTALVVQGLELAGGPNLVINSDYDKTLVPVPEGLIGGRVLLIK
jgi:Flp pilus assembly protein TadG